MKFILGSCISETPTLPLRSRHQSRTSSHSSEYQTPPDISDTSDMGHTGHQVDMGQEPGTPTPELEEVYQDPDTDDEEDENLDDMFPSVPEDDPNEEVFVTLQRQKKGKKNQQKMEAI